MRKITILGVTGSIGQQTLNIIRNYPTLYKLEGMASTGSDLAQVISIINEFRPNQVYLASPSAADELHSIYPSLDVVTGSDKLKYLVQNPVVSDVVVGVGSLYGIEPTLEAIKHSKKVVIANKETIIAAGHLISQALLDNPKAAMVPADSEHLAIFQCLSGCRDLQSVHKLYLTASGGPFAMDESIDLNTVTPKMALNHPTWSMGSKITIDSATLMNKGLEVIEAHNLFQMGYDKIQVLVHPQSLVHGIVEYIDGSMISHMSPNSMEPVIKYGLDFPQRKKGAPQYHLDLLQSNKLEFYPPNISRFPCLDLAYQAGKAGISHCVALLAADEVAVGAFLRGDIRFTDIPKLIEKVLMKHDSQTLETIQDIWESFSLYRSMSVSYLSDL